MSNTSWKKKPAFQTRSRSSQLFTSDAELTVGSAVPGKFSPQPVRLCVSSPIACPPHEKFDRMASVSENGVVGVTALVS